MDCSLVIPCFNEAPGLEKLVEKCEPLLASGNFEVILVNNGSTDATDKVLSSLENVHPSLRLHTLETNEGYGNGILAGLRQSRGRVIGWTHADLQTDPADALKALEHFEVDPSRVFVKGKRYGRPLSDSFFTAGMSIFETLLLRRVMSDINAQPTLFPREFFDTWRNPPKDFALDLYAYYLAKKAGLDIKRFPVHFGAREFGTSSWNVSWSAKKKFIKRTLHFSLSLRKRGAE